MAQFGVAKGHLRSLEIAPLDRVQCTAYAFYYLLYYVPILHHIWDIGDIGWKFPILFTPHEFGSLIGTDTIQISKLTLV